MILVVVSDGYHEWWCFGVELGGEMFNVSFSCDSEFGGVVMMMIRSL